MRTITLFLFAALAVTSIDAAWYEQNDGTIVDPIQSVLGGNLAYTGNNLEPGANLPWAWLPNADLAYANLANADLDYANLSGADLEGVILYEAILTEANLEGAILTDANLTVSTMSVAQLFSSDS